MTHDNSMYSLAELCSEVAAWHQDRNLVHGSTNQAQVVKLLEEAGELARAVARGEDVADAIGDMLVVLINIAERSELTLHECLHAAYTEIAPRRGRMVDGVFIKEQDND